MADPDLPIREGEGGHPDPEIRGWGRSKKVLLDPPLLSHCRQQSFIQDSYPVDLLIYLVMFVFQTLVKTLLGTV